MKKKISLILFFVCSLTCLGSYLYIFQFRHFASFISQEKIKDLIVQERLINEHIFKMKLELLFNVIYPLLSDEDKIDRLLFAAELNINEGKVSKAIEKINKANSLYKNKKLSNRSLQRLINEAYLVAFLREGENRNCALKKSNKSCIYPVKPDAIYKDLFFSKKANSVLLELIKNYPNENSYKWIRSLLDNLTINQRHSYLTINSHSKLLPLEDLSTEMGVSNFSNAGAILVDDFNNDMSADLIISSGRSSLKYYENRGDYFVDKSYSSNSSKNHAGFYAISIDYDNDRCLDVLLLRGAWLYENGRGGHSLLRGNCKGEFDDVTKKLELAIFEPNQVAVKADFNNDGFLDLFLGCESEVFFKCKPHLLMNLQGAKFKEMIHTSGIGTEGYIKGATVIDINNDNRMDLIISNMMGTLEFYVNETINNNIKFRKIDSGVQIIKTFSVMSFDFNNDGLFDVAVSRYVHPYEQNLKFLKTRLDLINLINPTKKLYIETDGLFNRNFLNKTIASFFKQDGGRDYGISILLNKGNEKFEEIPLEISKQSIPIMGSSFGDVNNDGFLDLYLGTGSMEFSALLPNRFLLNVEGKDLIDVTANLELGHLQKGHGIVFHDIDNNGAQDIIINSGGAIESDKFYKQIFMNNNHLGNFIKLIFKGRKSNQFGIGVRVKILTNEDNEIHREVGAHSSFGSTSNELFIGIGKNKKIKKLEITWPTSKNKLTFENVISNKIYMVEEFNSNLVGL